MCTTVGRGCDAASGTMRVPIWELARKGRKILEAVRIAKSTTFAELSPCKYELSKREVWLRLARLPTCTEEMNLEISSVQENDKGSSAGWLGFSGGVVGDEECGQGMQRQNWGLV